MAAKPVTASGCAVMLIAATSVGLMAAEQNAGHEMPPATAVISTQTEALYRSTVIVTGRDERNRGSGIAQCFAYVLVKVSGDQTILGDRRLPTLAAKAAGFVVDLRYRDLLEGRPVHDEQGTYDRPHFLTAAFDMTKVHDAVRALGREPWTGPRPRVVVFLGIENTRAAYMLASDGVEDRSIDMRSAFVAAADKAGIAVSFPTRAQLQGHGLTYKTVTDAAPGDLAAIAGQNGGDVAVTGRIVFREEANGWIARWRLAHGGKSYAWGARGINFDGAFRNAMFGVTQILSGHGQPK